MARSPRDTVQITICPVRSGEKEHNEEPTAAGIARNDSYGGFLRLRKFASQKIRGNVDDEEMLL
jgi:hypothetical protein